MSGFDIHPRVNPWYSVYDRIEVGGSLPLLPRLNVFGIYCYFQGNDVKTIHGTRFRSNVKITDWLSIDAEVNFDYMRKTIYFARATLTYQFRHKQQKRDVLWHKITQLFLCVMWILL